MDFIGLVDGQHVLVKVDFFSRKVQLDVCDVPDAAHVMRGLHRWMDVNGQVGQVVSDAGRAL